MPRSDEGVFSNLQRQAYTALVRRMLDLLSLLSNLQPTRIYTRASAWVWLTTLPAWAESVVDWIADISSIGAAPVLPAGVTTWKRRQYSFTGRVDGIIGDVDLNIDNVAPAPPPTGDEEMTIAQARALLTEARAKITAAEEIGRAHV